MELVARKADLVRELQFFQQIVERKNTIPILANVLIEGSGNEVTLLATDLEVALRSRCEAADRADARLSGPSCELVAVAGAASSTTICRSCPSVSASAKASVNPAKLAPEITISSIAASSLRGAMGPRWLRRPPKPALNAASWQRGSRRSALTRNQFWRLLCLT